MKKFLAFILVLALIFAFTGCAKQSVSSMCRILAVTADGFVADFYNGHMEKVYQSVYVPYPDADQNFQCFDTVMVEYSEDDFAEQTGTYTTIDGKEMSYQLLLTEVKSVRHLTDGEPTFG